MSSNDQRNMQSPTTPERLATLEEKITGVAEDVTEIKDFLKALDKRYASKWTEKIVYGLLGLVAAAIINSYFTKTETQSNPNQTIITNPK